MVASKKCPKCSEGIPETVLHIHISLLVKFEMLMLSEKSNLEFNTAFSERNISYEEPLFKAWLVLKNASLPTEAQVLQKVIEDHTAINIPKKKTTRKRNLDMILPVLSGKLS